MSQTQQLNHGATMNCATPKSGATVWSLIEPQQYAGFGDSSYVTVQACLPAACMLETDQVWPPTVGTFATPPSWPQQTRPVSSCAQPKAVPRKTRTGFVRAGGVAILSPFEPQQWTELTPPVTSTRQPWVSPRSQATTAYGPGTIVLSSVLSPQQARSISTKLPGRNFAAQAKRRPAFTSQKSGSEGGA